MAQRGHLLLFGGGGAIGAAIRSAFLADGWSVTATGRLAKGEGWLAFDPFSPRFDAAVLDDAGPFHAVCWAQGANLDDSVRDFDPEEHLRLYRANALFAAVSLNLLVTRGLLARPARLCVVSSIWQEAARQDKLSYAMSKAALRGFVLSAAADLGADGHLVNAVLPGALDTPMTRATLSAEQRDRLARSTPAGRLPTLEDVVGVVRFLCSEANTGVTAQFVGADLGFGRVHRI